MPRKKKQNAPQAEDSVAVRLAVAEPSEPAAKPAAPSREDDNGNGSPVGERFRSWVTDRARGYERLTDETAKLIVLVFQEKPGQETLDKLKDGGFRYRPEYFGLKKVWTRANDFAGREQVKSFETALRGATPDLPF
jgi:hypothetical protein